MQTRAELEAEIGRLIALEPRFGAVHQRHGTPALRAAPASLETLLAIVTEQFLSLKAAAAIWQRLVAELGVINAETVLACPPERLVGLGLSRAKARSFQACAAAGLDFKAEPEALRKALLDIWGIGPWTVEIFLLSALGHADAWPAGDVALQAAAQNLFALEERPDARVLARLGEAWRPHRASAARLLWAHYRGLNGLPQAPSQN